MLVKSAHPGEGGGVHHALPHFTLSIITSKFVVYAPAERAVTLPLFLLYPYMYSVQVTFSHYFCWGGGGWGIVIRVKGADRVKGGRGGAPPTPAKLGRKYRHD
jgi:hypothetical protein